MLTRTPIGARICIILLDDMVKLHDADEGSEGARAFDVGQVRHLDFYFESHIHI